MAEDHSLHHEFEDPEGLTPQQLAGMRWQAIEAFNGVMGISPMARRLGVKLIACMDARTRQCYPGEARIAAELGVHLSAVKKAKAELRDAELITWSNPGGPRHLSHYTFNWAALLRHAGMAKQRGDKAVTNSIEKRRQGTHTGTMGKAFNSTRTGTMERHVDVTVTGPKVPKTEVHSTQIGSQGTHTGTPIVPTRVPDTTQDITLKDTAQHITPSQANGGLGSAKDLDKPFVSQSAPQQTEPRRALEGRKKEPPKPLVFFPQLVEVLGKDNPKVTVAISRLGWDQQKAADLILATKGNEAALTYIREHDPKGVAA